MGAKIKHCMTCGNAIYMAEDDYETIHEEEQTVFQCIQCANTVTCEECGEDLEKDMAFKDNEGLLYHEDCLIGKRGSIYE